MPPRRSSATPTVLGIFNLIGGFLGLLFTLVSGIGLIAIFSGNVPVSSNPADAMSAQNHLRVVRPEYDFVEVFGFGVGFLFDVMLIVSGFGLLWRQKWARTIALTWAGMSFVNRIATTAYTVLVVAPVVRAYYDANLPPAQAGPMKVGASIGGCMAGLLVAYPIIVFCLLMTKSCRAAFEASARDEADDDEDYRDDRERGRPRSRDRDDYRDDDRGRPRRRDRDYRDDDRDDRRRY